MASPVSTPQPGTSARKFQLCSAPGFHLQMKTRLGRAEADHEKPGVLALGGAQERQTLPSDPVTADLLTSCLVYRVRGWPSSSPSDKPGRGLQCSAPDVGPTRPPFPAAYKPLSPLLISLCVLGVLHCGALLTTTGHRPRHGYSFQCLPTEVSKWGRGVGVLARQGQPGRLPAPRPRTLKGKAATHAQFRDLPCHAFSLPSVIARSPPWPLQLC